MSLLASRTARWLAPVGAVAVIGGASVGVPALAAGTAHLPALTAQQLLVRVQQADVKGLTGTVRVSTDLGLPALPSSGGDSSLQSLATGTHTLSVATAGPEQQRIGIHGSLEETEFVHNGQDVWLYSSRNQQVTHLRLPAPSDTAKKPMTPSSPADLTPQAMAQHALSAIAPSTQVSVGNNATVAGRSAYVLRLAPKSAASLIRQVDIDVDGQTGAPLGVTVLARGASKPAIDVAFTSVHFSAPAASTFHFTVPAGAHVTEHTLGMQSDATQSHTMRPSSPQAHQQQPTVLGTGWTSVTELHGVTLPSAAPARPGSDTGSSESGATMQALLNSGRQVSGSFGTGKLWSTRLVTVLLTSDGRLFIGAVTPQALQATAATAPR